MASGSEIRLEAVTKRYGPVIAVDAIDLGCAGMADLAGELSESYGLPVIDGVAAAVKLLEGLAMLGLRTSKIGGYAAPLAKSYRGELARFAPNA